MGAMDSSGQGQRLGLWEMSSAWHMLTHSAPVLGSAWDHGQEPHDALQPEESFVLHGPW